MPLFDKRRFSEYRLLMGQTNDSRLHKFLSSNTSNFSFGLPITSHLKARVSGSSIILDVGCVVEGSASVFELVSLSRLIGKASHVRLLRDFLPAQLHLLANIKYPSCGTSGFVLARSPLSILRIPILFYSVLRDPYTNQVLSHKSSGSYCRDILGCLMVAFRCCCASIMWKIRSSLKRCYKPVSIDSASRVGEVGIDTDIPCP